jgi:hypothetical protein
MTTIKRVKDLLPGVTIETFEPEFDADLCGDIDFVGLVGKKAFGIQIKHTTSRSKIGNYSASERMRNSFEDFTSKYGGKVFIVYSVDDEIANSEVIGEIESEVSHLSAAS